MPRLIRLLLMTIAFALALAAPARAQFETPNRQFHNGVGFPLEGRHRDIACESCHINNVFKGTPTRCFDCHWERRQDDRFKLQLGSQCEMCHRPVSWTSVRFDHAASTGMPLNGAHRQLACQTCHQGGNFQAANTTCISCHQQDFAAAQNPNHVAAGFPTTCEACHRPSDVTFNQARFDHQASFPLVGLHAQATCATCHRGNVFQGTPRDCVGCHRAEYERTSAPNHAAAGFPTTCDSCHRETDTSWSQGAGFNHASIFALVGTHAQAACVSCHRNNVYRGTSRDCVGCHQDEYNRTSTPNHAAAGFPTTCESCHRASDTSWRGSGFNHASIFALVGQHAQTACTTCHVNNVYRGTPRDCVGCHQDDYNRTSAPNHASAGFPTTCETCHRASDSSWRGASFNHNSVFNLVGRHASTVCESCHRNGVYRGTPRDCVGCHVDQYNRTTNPNHASSGFPTTCENCHRAADTSWNQGTFNHATVFALVGRHASATCTACHRNGIYRGTPRDCVGCHVDQYAPHDQPQPRVLRLPDYVRELPSRGRHVVEPGHLQPRHRLRAGGTPRLRHLHRLPPQRHLPRHAAGLRRLPHRPAQPHHQPEPRVVGLPHHLRKLSPGHGLVVESGHVQPPVPDHVGPASAKLLHVSPDIDAELYVPGLPRALAITDGQRASRPLRLPLRLAGLLQLPPERTELT
ncbi:MAG: multiheme c-type cytochrome [Vicinamibacterales bacterium]